MASNTSIFNVTRGYFVKFKYAVKGIENCAVEWVEEGVSVRDLTLTESIARRKVQARERETMREPLPYYEIPGIFFAPPVAQEKSFFASHRLVWEAHEFARKCAAA